MGEPPRTRWEQLAERLAGDDYAAHFARLAESGQDVHGEATFCAGLVAPGARILDAGCGTGRVAIRLAELGYDVTGVDVDASMLDVARRHAPEMTWLHGDLADLPGEVRARAPYDLVVMAGNVVPLLAPGTLDRTLQGLADVLAEDARLVAGFGLDPAHLPPGCPVTPLADYDAAADAAGLLLVTRLGTWDAQPFDDAGYAVSVHRPG
jgi:SAM-dependent methyltransferase